MLVDLISTLLPWGILATAPVALFGVVCAINRICVKVTRKRIAAAYVLIAWGWGAVIFALLDYLVHATPMFWPAAILSGVGFLSVGNALLFLVDRRRNCALCLQQRERSCP